MEQIEFEDDERYILFEHHKDKSHEAALRLLQLLHARNRINEKLENFRKDTQGPQKIDEENLSPCAY
jgi:hypothetical protein